MAQLSSGQQGSGTLVVEVFDQIYRWTLAGRYGQVVKWRDNTTAFGLYSEAIRVRVFGLKIVGDYWVETEE
jgi:hypothetical protein